MGERLRRMLVKEFLQLLRDPRMRFVIFIVPVIQTLVFGYAVNMDVRDFPVAVVDLDRSPASRALLAGFTGSGTFRFVLRTGDFGEAVRLVDRGEAGAILRIDPGFADAAGAGRTARFQLLVDGSDANSARIAIDYAARIAARHSLEMRAARIGGAARRAAGVTLVPRAWFNPNLDSRKVFVPGVIAMLVMLLTLMLTSMAIVREKEIGTIEQILVSPITPAEFILGKTIPFALIGYFDVAVVSAVGVWWFDVPLRGSIPLLFLGTSCFFMCTLGLGLLISTVSRTQQQALLTVFLVYFPSILLSGFMFPIANMPPAARLLTLLDPLRYFLVIVKGIFLKGVGMDVLWPQFAALTAMGAATLALAVSRFRKTLA
ncbi:MAG TPA: ABC transporter permease [Candidatus Deferrimicrobiaceae bacterium]